MRGRIESRAGIRKGARPRWHRAALLLALAAAGGCAQLRGRLGLERPAPGPVPVEVPTSAAVLGFDRVLRAPGEHDGRFDLVVFPDSTQSRLLADGDSAVLLDLTGHGVVRRIRLSLTSADPDWLRRVALRMYWDDEAAPSVEVPLGDFFADGFAQLPYAAVPMGVGDGGFYSYLPMPFTRRARIVLENGTGLPIEGLSFDADVQRDGELATPVATFHALWSHDLRPRSAERHLVADVKGAGWFIGTALSAQGYEGSLSFLEGSGTFRVDGRVFQGTTSASYLGADASGRGALAGAFQGTTLRDDARARVAAYRWHLPDPIPFRESLRLELERGRANRDAADFATVAYWYQTEPHDPFPQMDHPAERRAPDVLIPAEAVRGSDLGVIGTGAGTLRLIVPVPRADLYEVVVYPQASPGAAAPTVTVRGSRAPARSLDVGPPGAEPGDLLPGVVVDTVAVTTRALELELAAGGSGIALPAAVHMRPLALWAAEWQVVGPWPNVRTPGGGANPALDSAWAPEADPTAPGYAAPSGRAEWRPTDADVGGLVQLARALPASEGVAAYAQAFLWAPDARAVSLVLDTEDAHQIWVDGVLASSGGAPEAGTVEQDAAVALHEGWNRVLLKLATGNGPWTFRLRVADPSGALRWARSPI